MPAFDLAVVGAGFFGVRIALLLARRGLRVVLLERGQRPLGRASWVNQARVHNGYHYPRSLSTANGSHRHYERFLSEMAGCTDAGFEHLYAIARDGSFTTAAQFERFCRGLDLPLLPLPRAARGLFDPDRIEAAFLVREAAFDARAMRRRLEAELAEQPNLELRTGTRVIRVELGTRATLETDGGRVEAGGMLIVAYAAINALLRASGIEPLDLKAEITEVCLVDPPPELGRLGITVMDGPFFSTMPMPAEACHSLTHVRYTPHASWDHGHEPGAADAYALLERYPRPSRFPYMQRDAARFVPALHGLRHRGSLFEVKAVPNRHELDDGRPIMVRRHSADPLCASVLGAKLDSVFELEEAIVGMVGLESCAPHAP